jgi:hypothetical protein
LEITKKVVSVILKPGKISRRQKLGEVK